MGGIQISGSGTIVPNEYIKPCIDEIFQVFKKHFPEEMQTTEIITVILDLAKEQVRYKLYYNFTIYPLPAAKSKRHITLFLR